MNPTPTPLASTAMEAAREIHEGNRQWLEDRATLNVPTLASILQKHFQPLLAKVEAHTAEKEELLETGQKLSELVWENASEGDDAYEVEDVLESHYKLIATLREMLAARSAFELGLNAQIAALRAALAAKEAENKALLVLVHGDWRDKPDQWTKEIEAAHPMETNQFKQYEKALEMVGNRNGKYELVDLVNWLLSLASRADKGGAT